MIMNQVKLSALIILLDNDKLILKSLRKCAKHDWEHFICMELISYND